MIPQAFMYKYNLKDKAHNGYIFVRVTKGVYGLPQAGRISCGALVQHLELYGYFLSRKAPGLWIHNRCPNNFTLVVYDFGVKYLVKDHALHLRAEMKDKYKLTKDWEGKLCIGIALK